MSLVISDYLEAQRRVVEGELDRLISMRHGPHQQLFESARYALLGNGKRLRPILTLAATDMLGGDSSLALLPACTLEMIHTYSMIHDDLPCMDDDDYRRGQPTVHKKYSEGHAVLTGDFLLTYAFEVLATNPLLSPDKKSQLIAVLAKRCGSEGMIGGQVMDLIFEGKKINLDMLRLLHHKKTAALLTASVEFGGIIANVTETHLDCLRKFGEFIGLAFQTVDDILDVTSSQTKHGRAVSSDIMNEKSTYVSLLGIEQAHSYAMNFYEQAIHSLKPLPYDTSLLKALADFMVQRKY